MTSLAAYVRILAQGQGRARSMTQDEAESAMALMLSGAPAPEAVGAILMLLRMKGETAPEIAGFTAAARGALPGGWPGPAPDLDWPSYAAGRTRGLPWFLLSARLVARLGHRVLLHGWNSHQSAHASVRASLGDLGIPVCQTTAAAVQALDAGNIAYLPLETLSPALMRLLGLREVLGLRSCVNTVLRMLNPGSAPAAVQGVFHPPYRELQADAAQLLRQPALSVLKGGGGEFEHHPTKDIAIFGLRNGAPWTGTTGIHADGRRRLAETLNDPADLAAIWQGRKTDDFAEAVVISTAALALDTLGVADPEATAAHAWAARHDTPAQPEFTP